MMKIIYVEDCFNPIASYQINEILKQPHGKFEKVLITSLDMSPFHKELSFKEDEEFSKKYDVKIIRLPIKFKISGRRWLKGLYQVIKKENADIIYMHGIIDFKDVINILNKQKALLFRDCHMSWSAVSHKNPELFYRIVKYCIAFPIQLLNKYEKIYSLGVEETQYLETVGFKKGNIEIFEHGYNESEYFYSCDERKKIRNELGLTEDDILISYVGKFDDEKKPDILLDLIQKLSKEYIENKRLYFLFLGPQNEEYMKKKFEVKLKNLAEKRKKIKILPGRKAQDLREIYSGTDICFWPKQTTLSSIHAQACQTVVVMENELSNKERVLEQENLYQKNNIEEAILKIQNIIEKSNYLKEKKEWYKESLESREYAKKMKKKILEWENLVERNKR